MKGEANIQAVLLRKRVKGRLVAEPAIDRFMRLFVVDKETGCWNWLAATHYKGYGEFSLPNKGKTKAHRWSYQYFKGAIPSGLTIDHLCRNRGLRESRSLGSCYKQREHPSRRRAMCQERKENSLPERTPIR